MTRPPPGLRGGVREAASMIDLHCHILPGTDDGPELWSEAVRMARVAWDDGIRTVVATPHVGDVPLGAEDLRARVRELNRRLRAEGVALEVLPGAELLPQLPAETLREYALNGTGYVLIEFPPTHLPASSPQLVSRLVSEGLRPIVAHPERNPSVLRDPERLSGLVEAGALVQLTAESLEDPPDSRIRACARHLLSRGAVHFLATDAHSAGCRPPVLSGGARAAAEIVGPENARKLVGAHPEAVIAGRPIHG